MTSEELDRFEEILQDGLVKLCTGNKLLSGEILESPDIEQKWNEYITDYVNDAVHNMQDYTQAALCWAAFLGMGVAWNWDHDWTAGSALPYAAYYGKNGWDDMDENVLYNLCGYGRSSEEASHLVDTLLSATDAALALISHGNIRLDTEEGFYILVRSFEVMYRIGASICLHKLGYKKVPVCPSRSNHNS